MDSPSPPSSPTPPSSPPAPSPSISPSTAPGGRRSSLHRNGVSYFGLLVVVFGLVLVLLSVALQFSVKNPGPYFGIFTFVLFPGVIFGGLFFYGLGMLLESRRRRRTGKTEARPYPALDLNNPRQRLRFQVALVFGGVVFVVLAASGYNGFLLTESVPFCGSTCHTPMEPEFVAYQASPHARIECVECHVGGGAGHYVQSKMNGVRQLSQVVLGNYARPIPAPQHLRPARETCESCHWSSKSWGVKLYQRPHFRYDEKNTPEQITMRMRVGGGEGAYGSGIHWHMAADNEVTFVTNDEHNQDVPWVRVTRRDGTKAEYFRTDKPVDAAGVAAMAKHTMDCMDCHNRPAHDFETPDKAVDKALFAGVLSPTLPFAKSISVETLSKTYPTRDAAHDGIKAAIAAFYDTKYPDVAKARSTDVTNLALGIIGIYDRNAFPEMKVDATTYASNIGHRNSPGCFRCHDGKHVAADGKVLSNECVLCHTMPQRGAQVGMGESMPSAALDWHPWQTPAKHLDVKEHKNILCHECHEGGRKPKTECNQCHAR